jgi:hypothetical protein
VPVGPKILDVRDYDRMVRSGALFARKVDLDVDDELVRRLEARVYQ